MTDDALSELKVVDFGWVAAVPIMTLQLSLHGAQVLRVESSVRPDASRATSPFIDEEHTFSAAFGQLNTNKQSLGLNLKHPAAREIVLDLVEWADVVTENFRPGTLDKLGLGYDVLSQRNPKIVMLQSSSAGQNGPISRMAATGDLLQSLCGFTHLTGFPDSHPMPPWGAWTDITVPPIGVASVLAAVRQAERTGRGQLLDMSQMELSVAFLADRLLAAQYEGEAPIRTGNRDTEHSPHGVFRAAGADRWLAIAVCTDRQWGALTQIMGREDLASAYPTVEDRWRAEDEIESSIGAWLSDQDADDVEALLRASGVPCGVVYDSREVMNDPQLTHRDYFQYTEHPSVGQVLSPAASFVLSETPARAQTAAPEIGQDTWQICTELLGYDGEQVALLLAEGTVE